MNRQTNKFHRDLRHPSKKEMKVSDWKPIAISLLLTVGFTLLHEFWLAGVFLALAIGLTVHEHRSLKNEYGKER
tara:strand:+ start:643 stop:864 length:222 start_codon:yes stop_codon:yes gene_type:complete